PAQPQGVNQSTADQGTQAQSDAVATGHRLAVRVVRHGTPHLLGSGVRGDADFPQAQSLNTNSAEFSRAHIRSSTAARRSAWGPSKSDSPTSRSSTVGNREYTSRYSSSTIARGDAFPWASRAARPVALVTFRCSSGEFIRWSAWTTEVSLVRSQGGSWLGSGRPKVSRNSEGTRCVRIARAREPGGAAANVSGTPVTSETASSRTSARNRCR